MHIEADRPPFEISTDPGRLDVELITTVLAQSYWAPGIPRETVERSIRGSLCFGVYERHQQVGFARVITDAATYAYLADVFIVESHRGRGLSKWLVSVIVAHPSLQGLRRFQLVTRDAHRLYAPFGFEPIAAPERHMERVVPDVYREGRDRHRR